ncbi:MAG: hypothetical protein NTW30_01580 [Candidatus Aenigmarchaeota archaeon]|nr:hypothetical protein [Candidatus Aenigmarchaeota archaeon]
MKGQSLPSNIAVYLVITIIVIAAIVSFVYFYCPNCFGGERYDMLMRKGCLDLIKNCNEDLSQITVENKREYTLQELCNLNGISDENKCRSACGCIVSTT